MIRVSLPLPLISAAIVVGLSKLLLTARGLCVIATSPPKTLILQCDCFSLQSKPLSCEPCEKTFAVYAQYTAHMNTHVQCDDVGCSFSASGKVWTVFSTVCSVFIDHSAEFEFLWL